MAILNNVKACADWEGRFWAGSYFSRVYSESMAEDDDWWGEQASCCGRRLMIAACIRRRLAGNRLAVWLPGRGYVVLGSGLRGAWEVRHEERVARQVASAGECCAVRRCCVMSRCAGERDRGDEEELWRGWPKVRVLVVGAGCSGGRRRGGMARQRLNMVHAAWHLILARVLGFGQALG